MFLTEKLKTFSWINVGNPDHKDFEKLQNDYKIDEDTISDILDPDEQPRFEVEDDYKVIIVRFPIINHENDTLWHTEPLSIIYTSNRVITVCRKRCDLLDKIKKSEKTSREEFILNIMYYIAESYLRMLKELNKRVLASKRVLQERIRKKELMDLLEVENSYTLYMAGIKGNVAVLDKLEKVRGFVKTDEAAELAEDARIELAQATEVVATYGKMLKAIKETFESVINMDSNTNINRLTTWNIVLVIPTVIVGYYGMNTALPFADSPHAATGIFIAIMVLLLGFALFSTLRKRIIYNPQRGFYILLKRWETIPPCVWTTHEPPVVYLCICFTWAAPKSISWCTTFTHRNFFNHIVIRIFIFVFWHCRRNNRGISKLNHVQFLLNFHWCGPISFKRIICNKHCFILRNPIRWLFRQNLFFCFYYHWL